MLHVHVRGQVGIVHAPAKVNLFLEVLARRPDGFHEIETLISPIAIFDTLYFSTESQGNLRLTCNWANGFLAREQATEGGQWGPLPDSRNNLAWRAVHLFRERAGVDLGAEIHITKRIPAEAGLGGASADAAAALVAANRLWKVDWSLSKLAALAAELGSDIPVLVSGTASVCRGRGEQLQPAKPANRLDLVVVKPPVGLSTADVYRHCKPAETPTAISPLLNGWKVGSAQQVATTMCNRLQEPAEQLAPDIIQLRKTCNSLGLLGHQMTGSGSTYFGICRHAKHARQVAAKLRAMRLGEVFATTTLSH